MRNKAVLEQLTALKCTGKITYSLYWWCVKYASFMISAWRMPQNQWNNYQVTNRCIKETLELTDCIGDVQFWVIHNFVRKKEVSRRRQCIYKGMLKLNLPPVLTMYWLWVSQWVIVCLRSDKKHEIKQL